MQGRATSRNQLISFEISLRRPTPGLLRITSAAAIDGDWRDSR
jgi:hypothetical protein